MRTSFKNWTSPFNAGYRSGKLSVMYTGLIKLLPSKYKKSLHAEEWYLGYYTGYCAAMLEQGNELINRETSL